MEKKVKDKGVTVIREEGRLRMAKKSNKRMGIVGDLRLSLVSSSLIPLREK